jgi:glycine/D-amino acid oxidase-like deaminating enzyme
MSKVDRHVLVIGGGIYGCFVAYQIAARFPRLTVTVLERENALFTRASSTNQGQLHMGYMYSADTELAAECVRNAKLFAEHFPTAIDADVTSYYGVHRESEIDPAAYEDFCRTLGIPLRPGGRTERGHFGAEVEAVYTAAERTFNAGRLHAAIVARLAHHGVEVRLSHSVHRVEPRDDGSVAVVLDSGRVLVGAFVYNVAFADINELHERSQLPDVPIRREVFLHFLLDLRPAYVRAAVSVIRGPFASIMPSRFRGGHLLAAAAYRRIETSDTVSLSEYIDDGRIDKVCAEAIDTCSAYLPALRRAVYMGHVIGTRAAVIDPACGETTSRVTTLLDFAGAENYHVVLGGKVGCLFEAHVPALAGIRAGGL